MLALTRRAGERLIIGDDIVLTVVEVRGDNVKIAIEAPKEVKIYRGEIYAAIVAENKQALTPLSSEALEAIKKLPGRK